MSPEAPSIETLDAPVLRPQPGVPWAETTLLNPAIIDEPGTSRIHMLFRASGPWAQAQRPGQPIPYPIFLGYAWSDDAGVTWQADLSRPALAPALEVAPEKMFIRRRDGREVVNHANGCIEDPRLFRLDGRLYCSTACRMFPPGPYWENDDPMQCAPEWAREGTLGFDRAAAENVTVTVLWEVDLPALRSGDYERAFCYVTHLTDPERGDNRDAFLLPRPLLVGGSSRYLCLHRPADSGQYDASLLGLPPSIFLASASRLEDLPLAGCTEHRLLAQPELPWEGTRIGASWVPIPLENGEWLLPYHGKLDGPLGYTQSFMILEPGPDGWPAVKNRCPDRLMVARKDWELAGIFPTPCVFTCGGLVLDGRLLMTYGAADTVAGAAWTDFDALVARVRCFDPHGQSIPG